MANPSRNHKKQLVTPFLITHISVVYSSGRIQDGAQWVKPLTKVKYLCHLVEK